jgi:hypothetical protein
MKRKGPVEYHMSKRFWEFFRHAPCFGEYYERWDHIALDTLMGRWICSTSNGHK